jgi:hypothetical protein
VKLLAWLSVAVLLGLTACGSEIVATGTPSTATSTATPAPSSPAPMNSAIPRPFPTEPVLAFSDADIERAENLCNRMQARLAPGSLPSMGMPETAAHALRTMSAADPARSWLAAMPADHFVAMCAYTQLPALTGVPSGLPDCPSGSAAVDSSTNDAREFWITEDGQYRPYQMPPMPFTFPSCISNTSGPIITGGVPQPSPS